MRRCPNHCLPCNAFKAKDHNTGALYYIPASTKEASPLCSSFHPAIHPSASSTAHSQSAIHRHGQDVLQQRIGGGGRVQPPGAAGRRHHRPRLHPSLHAAQEALRRRLPVLLTAHCSRLRALPLLSAHCQGGSQVLLNPTNRFQCRRAGEVQVLGGAEQARHWFLIF